ncbi:MAG: diguanylate cyclase [bacterium]|nr:diguanylate cyclase [bacterium]
MKIPKLQNKKSFFYATITTLCVVSLICILYQMIGNKEPYQDGVWLNTGWKITINDQVSQDVNLNSFSFPATQKGDHVLLENTLPEQKITDPVLRILAYHATVKVKLDGEQIYEYGADHETTGRIVGSGYHYVTLPENYEGQKLEISLGVTEINAFTSLDGVLLEEDGKIITDFIYENRMILCISVFLIVFGCVLILIASFAQFYNQEFRWPLWISLFSIAIGVWVSCNYKLIQLFSQKYDQNTLLEYTALYFSPVPIMVFFYVIGKEMNLERWIYRILSICSALFFAVMELLQIFNIVHLPAALTIYQVLLVAYIPFILLTVIRHIKDESRTLRIISCAIIALAVFSGCDLVRYNIRKYILPDFMKDTISIMPVGTLLFVIILIISYCVSLVDNMYIKAEHELLLKMAYSDELTNIHNRAKCEEVLQELEYDEKGYAILSLDLNNLKQINDSLGHACGDRLLKDFAAILGKTFAADGTVGRFGGDEFIVILPQITKTRLQGRLQFMEDMMGKQNVRERDIRLSVAWGYAFNTECAGGDSEAVYELADQRMYKMKRKMKDAGLIADR